MTVELRGSTWNHVRGLNPMVATARAYRFLEPDVQISWEARSLQDFGSFSVTELAEQYDLMVIDHPHLGDAAAAGALLALDTVLDPQQLGVEAVGPSAESYVLGGHPWALAIDTAAQVAAYRPDLLPEHDVPRSWDEVAELARDGSVLWPVKPLDAICCFLSLAANRGTPLVSPDGEFMSVDDAVTVLEIMRTVTSRIPAECFSWDPIQALDALSADQMQYRYIPLAFAYSNYSRPGFAPRLLRAADLPGNGSAGSLLGGAGIAVSARCADPIVAARHAAWVASAEVQRGDYVASGGQPAATAAWDDDAANEQTDQFFRRIRTTLDRSWLRPRSGGFPAWQDAAGDIVHAALTGKKSVERAAASLADEYERIVSSGKEPRHADAR